MSRPSLFVLGDLLVRRQFVQLVIGVTANVANGNFGLFNLLVYLLDELFAPFFRQGRDVKSDQRTVVVWRETDVRLENRLLDHPEHVPLPRLDGQHAHLWGRHAGDLIEWCRGAVILDLDTVEKGG